MKDKKADNNVPQSKGKRIAKAILNTVINVLIVLVLITSVVVATLALTSKANNGVPSIFGFSFHTIQTGSMKGGNKNYEGGNYEPGDLVIGKVTNASPNDVYEVGDIVVYTLKDEEAPNGVRMITHRVVEREKNESGYYYYITKGDNNSLEDTGERYGSDIVAVCYDSDYHGAVLKGVGGAMDYIRTPGGFFVVVLIPMIIFFLYEIIRVVLNTMNYKKSKAAEDKESAEREKQEAVDAAVKAALEAQKNAQSDAPAPAPAEPAPSADMSPEELEEFRKFQEFKRRQKEQKEEE